MILLTLGGLGVESNKHAPKPGEVMVYAPKGADHMVFFDARSVLPPAWKMLQALPADKRLKSFPQAQQGVAGMVAEAQSKLSEATEMLGFHPVTDLDWAAAWVRYPEQGQPDFLIVARGAFGATPLASFAKLTGKELVQLGARTVLRLEPGVTLGQGPDGALLLGTTAWVEPRIRATWGAVSDKGFTAEASRILAKRPFLMLASRPSPTVAKRFARNFRDPDLQFFKELLTDHRFGGAWLAYNGLGWTWTAHKKAGAARVKLASEGVIEILRAWHPALRGFTRLALAVLPSYASQPVIQHVLEHKDWILKTVLKHSGDGNFAVRLVKKGKTVTVEATAKRLSQVLPVTGFLPVIGAGVALFTMKASATKHEMYEAREPQVETGTEELAPQPAPK